MRPANKWIASTFVMVFALVVSGCSNFVSSQPRDAYKKLISATIITYLGKDGKCHAKVSPHRIQPKQKEGADWTIVDLCDATVGYTKALTLEFPPASNPKKCDGNSSPLLSPTYDPKYISAEINSKCVTGDTFSYIVKDPSGVELADPELEIGS